MFLGSFSPCATLSELLGGSCAPPYCTGKHWNHTSLSAWQAACKRVHCFFFPLCSFFSFAWVVWGFFFSPNRNFLWGIHRKLLYACSSLCLSGFVRTSFKVSLFLMSLFKYWLQVYRNWHSSPVIWECSALRGFLEYSRGLRVFENQANKQKLHKPLFFLTCTQVHGYKVNNEKYLMCEM